MLETFFAAAQDTAKELQAVRAVVLLATADEVVHAVGTSGWDLEELRAALLNLHQDLGQWQAK